MSHAVRVRCGVRVRHGLRVGNGTRARCKAKVRCGAKVGCARVKQRTECVKSEAGRVVRAKGPATAMNSLGAGTSGALRRQNPPQRSNQTMPG